MRVCFVLLPDSKPLSAAPLEKALKEFPDLGKVSWLSSTREGTKAFNVGKLNVLAALMPVAVPEGEADGATDHSLSGLDGSWTLPEHRAHLVVAQQGATGTDVEELTTFTRVVAAIVRATNAVGLYWGEGGATHHPEFVVNIAQSELPLPIWVGVSVAKSAGGPELLSIGMKQLGLPDLLLSTPGLDGTTFELFYDLLAYVVRRGKKLPEGDSVGRTPKEKLKVRYVPSPIHPEDQVWNVVLPAPPKAKVKKKKAPAKVAKKKKKK
ncbi:MAG: DUF4261 domain-containing protein [Archangium sp.]|nr:DUF4261 domain-containing protein [Archangium sp.]MDP3157302.1 DUF4261 domain-containing protein [Archangium sp.]MDP3571140.1 DUF4261 domain-containing protein [Archangium sp.]